MPRSASQFVTERELVTATRNLAIRNRNEIQAEIAKGCEAVAAHYGLLIRTASLPDGKDGAFGQGPPEIILSSQIASIERRRFTFYHELMHYLIYQDDDLLSAIHQADDVERTLERLCNVGAAEFLIPAEEVSNLVQEHGFSTQAIPIICESYGASAPAVAIQIVTQCARHHCYLVVAEPRIVEPNRNQLAFLPVQARQELCVVYSARSPTAKYTIARGTPISSDHLIADVFRSQLPLTGKAKIPFRSGRGSPVDCSAIYFRSSVYAFFNMNDPVSPLQLQLL